MGTALAEYRQCIGAEVVCHFHLLLKILKFLKKQIGIRRPFLRQLFSTPRIGVFFS